MVSFITSMVTVVSLSVMPQEILVEQHHSQKYNTRAAGVSIYNAAKKTDIVCTMRSVKYN